MDNIQAIVKAEVKTEIPNSAVEITLEDIIKNDSDGDPLDDGFLHANQLETVTNALGDATNAGQDFKGQGRHSKRINDGKGKNNLGLVTGVQKTVNNDKNSEIPETLCLNYGLSVELFNNNNSKQIQKKDTKNEEIPLSQLYLTNQGISIKMDLDKVTVTKQPTSYHQVFATEYTEEDNKFRCNHCHSLFNCKKYLSKHIRCIHRSVTKTYKCPYCPLVSKYHLRYHIMAMHKQESDQMWFRCDQCDYKSIFKHKLTQHVEVHISPYQMAKCDQCPKMYKRKKSLQRHIDHIHERHRLKKFKCKECNSDFNSATVLKYHVTVHHSNTEGLETLQCTKCSFKTKFEQRLRSHMSIRHPNNLLQCEQCGFRTAGSLNFKLHLICHKETKNEADLKYRCDKCDYKTFRQYSLYSHKLNHLKPEEIQFFYCHHCDFKAKRKDNLKTHVLRHFKKNEVPFQCYICDFTTKQRDRLMSHIAKHSKEAVNKIEADEDPMEEMKSTIEKVGKGRKRNRVTRTTPPATKRSKQKSEVISPADNQLEDVDDVKSEFFYCSHCDFTARRRDTLKTHILRHFKNNEVPFQCYICDFTTKQRDLLMVHIDKHSKAAINDIKKELENIIEN